MSFAGKVEKQVSIGLLYRFGFKICRKRHRPVTAVRRSLPEALGVPMSAMDGVAEGLGRAADYRLGSRAAVSCDTCFVGLVAKAAYCVGIANASTVD
jgi:hypothetical protein